MKYAVIAFCLLATPFLSKAQDSDKNFQLGFTASPNIGWIRVNDGDNSFSSDGTRIGFSYGLIGDFGFSRNYFFSTAFTITSINANIKVDNGSFESTERAIKLQYIDIPLTVKLKTNELDGKCFYGQFGLGTGIKIRGKQDIVTKTGTTKDDERKNQGLESDNFLRLGLVAGAGVQWNYNENSKFITGVTFNNGFTKIFSKGPDLRNSFVALNLGVLF